MVYMVAMGVISSGYLEADELTHFLKAREIWVNWRGVLDIWARPGCTGPYGLVALLGFTAARMLAVGITGITGLGTVFLLKQFVPGEDAGSGETPSWVRRHAVALVWLLLVAQPMFVLYSFMVMTEMMLGCVWVWAAVVLMRCRGRRRRGVLWASVLVGMGGLVRPEGWVAIACWPVFAGIWLRLPMDAKDSSRAGNLMRGRSLVLRIATATVIAGCPVALWYLLGVFGQNDWGWVQRNWPWSPTSRYGKTAGIFVLAALGSMAVWLWLPIAVGMRDVLRRQRREQAGGLSTRALLVLAGPVVGLFVLHGVLGSFGLFGSMSLPRYFLSIAPMAAVLGVMGLISLERRARRTRVFRATLIAASLAPVAVLMAAGYLPTIKNLDLRRLDVAIDEIRRIVPESEWPTRLIIGHPYVLLKLNVPMETPANLRVASADAIRSAPAGTILVTDSLLWSTEGRPKQEQLVSWGYRLIPGVAERIDAVQQTFRPVAITGNPENVRLWIKQETER